MLVEYVRDYLARETWLIHYNDKPEETRLADEQSELMAGGIFLTMVCPNFGAIFKRYAPNITLVENAIVWSESNLG